MGTMDTHPYHNYLFFDVSNDFYQLPSAQQEKDKKELLDCLSGIEKLIITPYATLGLKTSTTFMLWCRGKDPTEVQNLLRELKRTKIGQWLTLSYTYFGIVRPSRYSGRTGKPEQVIQNYDERLPFLILYPFTKTTEWYLLDDDNRRSIMGQHIKVGLSYPQIRQCLLYSYGIDDYEFLVSYETKTLEEFQDLILDMRKTIGRQFTLKDTPIFTCVYKSADELLDWL